MVICGSRRGRGEVDTLSLSGWLGAVAVKLTPAIMSFEYLSLQIPAQPPLTRSTISNVYFWTPGFCKLIERVLLRASILAEI